MTLGTNNAAMDVSVMPSFSAPTCARCGAPIVRRRRSARQDRTLCLSCDQRARRASYFRSYYETNKDRILTKNRRWARENKDKLVQLRQARQARLAQTSDSPRYCLDCGTPVVRAERCRRCYIRHRYANDADYRSRRLATTRRWLNRRQRMASTIRPRAAATPLS